MKKLCDSLKKYGYGRFTILIIFFILPYVSIRMAGQYEWLGRLVGLTVALGVGVPTLIWHSVNPKSEMVSKDAKLNLPKYKKVKSYIALTMRIILFLIGVILLWGCLVPLVNDTNNLIHGQRPILVNGIVSSVVRPFPLLEFISQEVVLEKSGTKSSYRFYYSFRPRLRRGAKYELLVLPKSKMVLEAKEIKQLEIN